MRLNSISFEISILHTAFFGLVLAVFSAILYLISNTFFQQVDQQLKIKVQAIDSTIKSYSTVYEGQDNAFKKAAECTIVLKEEGPRAVVNKLKKVTEKWTVQYQSLNLTKDYILFF